MDLFDYSFYCYYRVYSFYLLKEKLNASSMRVMLSAASYISCNPICGCIIYSCAWFNFLFFIKTPKCTKFTVNITSKRPDWGIDLQTKLKVIMDYEGGKYVTVIARQSGMSHSTTASILKNKNEMMEAVKGSTSSKAPRLTKFWGLQTYTMEILIQIYKWTNI